jgi:hypothetical protein
LWLWLWLWLLSYYIVATRGPTLPATVNYRRDGDVEFLDLLFLRKWIMDEKLISNSLTARASTVYVAWEATKIEDDENDNNHNHNHKTNRTRFRMFLQAMKVLSRNCCFHFKTACHNVIWWTIIIRFRHFSSATYSLLHVRE